MSSSFGGNPTLCNQTPYNWTLSYQHTFQMVNWTFPEIIPAGSCSTCDIVFDTEATIDRVNDTAQAGYALVGTTDGFEIQAKANATSSYWLSIFYQNITTNVSPQGTTSSVPFTEDFNATWTLLGSHGGYIETFVPGAPKV